MGAIKTVTTISTDEGVLAFWKGIPAAWLREASYTAIRLGLYKPIVDSTGATGFLGKCSAGCVAGGIGSVVGNPFDVLKTKMMASEGTAEPIIKVAERIKDSQGMGGFYRGMNVLNVLQRKKIYISRHRNMPHKYRKNSIFFSSRFYLVRH
jgi:hypothetical protein